MRKGNGLDRTEEKAFLNGLVIGAVVYGGLLFLKLGEITTDNFTPVIVQAVVFGVLVGIVLLFRKRRKNQNK